MYLPFSGRYWWKYPTKKRKISEGEEVRSRKKGIVMEERQGNSQDKLKGSSVTRFVYLDLESKQSKLEPDGGVQEEHF